MISEAWVAWIAENLLRGGDPDEVVQTLVSGGLSDGEARAEVEAVRRSPILAGASRLVRRSAGVEQAARLRRTLDRTAPLEASGIDERAFHLGYFSASRPLVLRGAASAWPAASWTHAGLAERLGEVEVEAMVGRSRHERWWLHRKALGARMPLRELMARCLSEAGDDVYAVGRNDVLAEPGLAPLREELGVLPGIDPTAPAARLWIGPAGTRTPLHHDQSSAWLVQLEGSKTIWLASPLEPALMTTAEGVFNTADPRAEPAGELAEVAWLEAVLEPGDAAFVPAGWWHQVIALEASISASLGGFLWSNTFSWYCPGR